MNRRLAKKIAWYRKRNTTKSRRFFRRHPEYLREQAMSKHDWYKFWFLVAFLFLICLIGFTPGIK